MKKLSLLISLAISGITSPVALYAQSEQQEMEQITITGQKIARTQMETVSSVMVIDDQMLLDNARTGNLFDVLDMAPNVTNAGGFNRLAIRGISNSGVTSTNSGAGTIGVFIDNGLVTPRGMQDNAIGTWDIDSIEVLRGPQSTTGGRNSLAGQIIIRTKAPEFDSNGAARVSFGEHGTVQTALMQTGALTNNLAYRITADYQRTDGYLENDILQDDAFNRNNTSNFRLKLLYQLDNEGEVNLTLGRNRFRENGDAAVDSKQSGRKSRLNYPSFWDTKANHASLTVTLPLNKEWEFQSNTGYIASDFFRTTDFDGSSSTPVVPGLIPGTQIPTDTAILDQQTDDYNFNQEFLLRFNNDKIRSVMGLYLAQGESDDYYIAEDVFIPFPNPFYPNPPLTSIPLLLDTATASKEEFTTYALFGDIDYKLTDQFTLMAGLRVNRENRENQVRLNTGRAISYLTLDPIIDSLLSSFSGNGASDKDSTVVLPKLGFNYEWNKDLTTGFVIQKGYRPGGVSVNLIRGEVREYDEESTVNYEASLRWRVNQDTNFNANLFYTDWKDQQVAVAPKGAVNPNDFLIENAGRSSLNGFELNADTRVTPDWTIYGGVGYTNTEIDEFRANPAAEGKEFEFSRKFTANLGSTYLFGDGWLSTVNVSHAGSGAPSLNSNDHRLSAYTLVNVKVGYEAENWSASIYANNLLDDEYETQRRNNPTYGDVNYADPRVVGVELNVNW